MTATAILSDARSAGVTLWAEGDALRYRGPREVIAKLLPELKAHKPAVLAELPANHQAAPTGRFPQRLTPFQTAALPHSPSDPACSIASQRLSCKCRTTVPQPSFF